MRVKKGKQTNVYAVDQRVGRHIANCGRDEKYRQPGKETNRQIVRRTKTEADRQMDRQTERERKTDTKTSAWPSSQQTKK